MKPSSSSLVVCALGVALAVTGHARGNEIQWSSSYASAKKQAKKADALIMLDFYTDWCSWCKKLERDTYTDDRVIKLTEQLVPVKINAEKNRPLTSKFKVRGYPSIVFADATGHIVGKIGGYMPPEPFAGEMTQIIKRHKELPELESRYKTDPDDAELAATLVKAYASRGDGKKARELIEDLEKADSQDAKGRLAGSYLAMADYYMDKDNLRSATKEYDKAIASARNVNDTAEARLGLAYAYMMERSKFGPGSRAYKARTEKARKELDELLATDGLPEDKQEQARQMMGSIAEPVR